jgi:hypothetical protein
MVGKRQFSLRNLLIATAFLAGVCAVAKLSITSGEPVGLVFGVLAFATLPAGGIGSLYDRPWDTGTREPRASILRPKSLVAR